MQINSAAATVTCTVNYRAALRALAVYNNTACIDTGWLGDYSHSDSGWWRAGAATVRALSYTVRVIYVMYIHMHTGIMPHAQYMYIKYALQGYRVLMV